MRSSALVLALSLLFSGDSVLAQTRPPANDTTAPPVEGARPPADTPRRNIVGRIDGDKDGWISRAEFMQSRMAQFRRLDADGDGAVSNEEWAARRANANPERVQRAFERFDRNGDGKISSDEWAAASEQLFARIDRDRDGFLTEDETSAVRGRRAAAPRSP